MSRAGADFPASAPQTPVVGGAFRDVAKRPIDTPKPDWRDAKHIQQ